MGVINSFKHAWNAFMNRAPTASYDYGYSSSRPLDRSYFNYGNEGTILASIYNRIGIDVAQNRIEHVRVNEDGRYEETIDDELNQCLTVDANLDQTGRELIQDIAISMMDEGYVAVIPVDTSIPPVPSGAYIINSLRTGKIIEWYPKDVRVEAYDERDGQHHELVLPKKEVAIIQNPLYEVMNSPNSTLQRLKSTLHKLDKIDDQLSSEKLNIIFQSPYMVRSERSKQRAEKRREELESQLENSKLGIGFIDAAERVIQLNRPIDNNMIEQINYLEKTLYAQLGLTQGVFDGTADEKEILNYRNRTIEPILMAIIQEMERKFLTKTARTQGQRIRYYVSVFRMATAKEFTDMSDSLTRNAIISTNEVRSEMGIKPSKDPDADALRNKNLNADKNQTSELTDIQNGGEK